MICSRITTSSAVLSSLKKAVTFLEAQRLFNKRDLVLFYRFRHSSTSTDATPWLCITWPASAINFVVRAAV